MHYIYFQKNPNPMQQTTPSQQQQQQRGPGVSSDEPPYKKLARDRLDFKNPHELPNKENQSNREVILGPAPTHPGATPTVAASTALQAASGSSDEKSPQPALQPPPKSLSSNFNAQLSLKTAEAEARKTNYEKMTAAKLLQDENQKKTQMLKLEVQQKARELMIKQMRDQKLLLQKYEQVKTVEEKSLILSLIKKLNESVEKLNSKKATAPVLEQPEKASAAVGAPLDTSASHNSGAASPSIFGTSPFSFQKVANVAAKAAPPPPHHLKLNNKRLNKTNFLKHGNPNAANNVGQSMIAAAYSFSRVSVDNRPKSLLVNCAESSGNEKAQILNFVQSLGCQIESVLDCERAQDGSGDGACVAESEASTTSTSKAFVVTFATRKDAEVVMIDFFGIIRN